VSKYDELCKAYVAARTSFFRRRDACSAFADILMKGFEGYLQSSLYQLRFIPRTGETTDIKACTPQTAVWLGADGRWHFLIGLPLVEKTQAAGKGGTSQMMRFDLHVAPSGDRFDVGVTGFDERFDLPKAEGAAEYQAFYDFLFERMMAVYGRPDLKFLDHAADSRLSLHGDR
jgi:hypothetical protein